MALSWYVLRTDTRSEYAADSELRRDGFEVYFPCIPGVVQRAGHSDAPLFPGYLFVRCDLQETGGPNFKIAHHVVGWVKFDFEFPAIPDEAIDELKRHVDGMGDGEGLWNQFQTGDTVNVISKNLNAIAQVIESAKSADSKAKVIMEFMGRFIPTQVPWQDLHVVDPHSKDSLRITRRTRGKGRWVQGYRPKETAKV